MSLEALAAVSQPTYAGYRDVTAADIKPLLTKLKIVDVRGVDEFHGPLGHIEGAHLVPLGTVGAQALTWNRDTPLLLVCRSGGRSAAAASELARMGFRNVYNLVGGMTAWSQARLPTAA